MTWMMPLLALTSGVVTLASLIMTVPLSTVNVALAPLTMVATMPSVTLPEGTAPATTW